MRFNERWESEKTNEEKEKEKKEAKEKEEKEKNTYRDIVKFEDIVKQNALKTSIRPIRKSQIPKGKEHLYIKKSNVILPSCPVCPTLKKCDTKLCPPCPEPEVCPNNPIDCKMVPIWNDPTVKKYLPKPNK